MLTINDYNHLKLLYDRFSKMNKHIKNLVLKGEWDNVDIAVQQKDSLLRQIILFEKPRLEKIKKNSELNKIRLNLIELEKENIALVKKMKMDLVQELSGVRKTKKILNTYEPSVNKTVSTFEVTDEE